jgi:DNA-binding NtrC family response regulator
MISHRTANWFEEVPPIRVVGTSDAMRRVQRTALMAARGNGNVLIDGERGVGKAVVARFIHQHSHRSAAGFATIKCDGLPDLLFESALFGHKHGSFAGAYRDKRGLVDAVAGGTIFIDEVGALSLRSQERLLRFLETGEYRPIGGGPIQVEPWLNVRVIASTTADLPELVAAGLFLDDLYVRLSVNRLSVPPLRDRRDDIPTLVDHFTAEFAGPCQISGSVRDALCRAEWPGNVRELKSVVLRQVLNAAGGKWSDAEITWMPRRASNLVN